MRRAVVLAGSLGLGHEMMARCCAEVLERWGWRTRTLNSMSLLGRRGGYAGEALFHRMVAAPGMYDGLHFAHLRTGSRLARAMEKLASARLVPALRAELAGDPADLVISVFATGAAAAARLKGETPALRTVVLCTDASVHRLWVNEGTDLFLVTSTVAEASVRRFMPDATVAVVPPPVRDAFYRAPDQRQARAALDVPVDDRCVLVIDSGWGFGPLVGSVAALAEAGVHVLAVAGRQRAVERRFRELAARNRRVHPFGFTDRVPELMAAADVVVALPGANTCAEAHVVGRPLLLLDVMPGHGRDNLQHELELGARVCEATPHGVTAAALALLDDLPRTAQGERDGAGAAGTVPTGGGVPRWESAFLTALGLAGIDGRGGRSVPAAACDAVVAASPDRSGSGPPAAAGDPRSAPHGGAVRAAVEPPMTGAQRPETVDR